MRLSDVERRALRHAMRDVGYAVSIFGSRVDDAKRGGDIDVLVVAPDLAADERLALSLRMAVAFRSVCDEKIDVHVVNPSDLTAAEKAFLGTIQPEKLLLDHDRGGRAGAAEGSGAPAHRDRGARATVSRDHAAGRRAS